ncbi:putative alpha amylase, catalytic domain subfamily [Podospora appendiculata]|uniref:Alpha amylase, catalytic domain subfamily n=1 Tax=Podospora appendiculata TaxID=314037 RepID=A0AAE0XJ51_9PEZI|nr:putative alpha amylase, catalytic domain subfamily [Podospora appendiculata]
MDILNRRTECFVLWAPLSDASLDPPFLIIGSTNGNSGGFAQTARVPLVLAQDKDHLWLLDPATISPPLADGVYHYWFEVQDTSPEKRGTILVTDPLSFTVDYSVTRESNDSEILQPASVIKFRDGKLWPCDIDGTEPQKVAVPAQSGLPSNNHLVIYELPTSRAKVGNDNRGVDVDVGTFADVLALFDTQSPGSHFSGVSAVHDEAILSSLGINALELLPAADAKTKGEWGYATANYFAPDADLGSSSDLSLLVEKIHNQNIRLLTDVVMAFGHDPYGLISFDEFHIRPDQERDNPDSYQSHATGVLRDGYGGKSWRYIRMIPSYNPETGDGSALVHPSWAFHRLHLTRWMNDFGVGGLRLDSVNNIGNWDFVRSYKERAWELYNARYGGSADPSKFIVVGEELSMPISMVQGGVLNALWNEPWQGRLRASLLGESVGTDPFEWTIRKLVNCKLDDLGGANFTDGAQAVNYITSHDIEGYRKERLYNFIVSNGIYDVEKRAKLAFSLLLTSVGIPMIFAGEEFADQMDRSVDLGKKQTDPVNYSRKNDGGWRQELFGFVANLVKFRTACPALGEDDTDFFHVDQSRGGKIMAWRRGQIGEGKFPVVVVANFSDEDTPGPTYVVPNWPDQDKPGWREVSQQRHVPPEWVGREPLLQWEAKVYTRWQAQGESAK